MISLLAFALRLHGLDAHTFWGDEYGSLIEAQEVGRNLHGLAYFLPIHFWFLAGDSEFWGRMPSVFMGVLTVPVSFQLGRRILTNSGGVLLAFLMAISSFAVMYSQVVRFYSLFLFASALSLWAYLLLCDKWDSRPRRLFFAFASLLVLTSHFFGLLVIAAEGAISIINSGKGKHRKRNLAGILLVGALGLTLMAGIPGIRSAGWSTLMRLTGNLQESPFAGSRGLSLINLAKIPVTFYMFALGEGVYPLTYYIVLPGLLVFGLSLVHGLGALARDFVKLGLVGAIFAMLFCVFLVFDPLATSAIDTAAPRYVIFALPAFLVTIVAGLAKYRPLLTIGVVFCSLLSLAEYYQGDWNYEIPVNINWRAVALFAQSSTDSNGLVLHDGRSNEPVEHYFKGLRKESYWNSLQAGSLDNVENSEQVVFVTDDFRPIVRSGFDETLGLIEREFRFKSGQVHYPMFEYVFERKPHNHALGYPVDQSTGQITLPKEVYGLEFQDLALPGIASFANREIPVWGSFALPDLHDNIDREIPLNGAESSSTLILLSSVTGASHLQAGEPVARLTIRTREGQEEVYVLRLGQETQDWAKDCLLTSACRTALAWHKYVALLGQSAYDGAWSDFQAKIFGTEISRKSSQIESLSLRYLASSGQLHVWGIALSQ